MKKKTDNPLNTITIVCFLQTRLFTEKFSRTRTIHPGIFRGRALIAAVASEPEANERGSSLIILGDPGATSRDDAIFLGESLLQELKSLWELFLTEPVPEVVEFHHADWAEKYFSAQTAMRSSRITLSPSYTK